MCVGGIHVCASYCVLCLVYMSVLHVGPGKFGMHVCALCCWFSVCLCCMFNQGWLACMSVLYVGQVWLVDQRCMLNHG